jgi:hypothetical protein
MELITDRKQIFLCPRCGTVKIDDPPCLSVYVPKLVERCREFEKDPLQKEGLGGLKNTMWAEQWKSLSIAESINPPDRRPT